MVVTNARIMDKSVNKDKVTADAVRDITLPVGGTFIIRDSNGFPFFIADGATRKVSIRGNIDKIR